MTFCGLAASAVENFFGGHMKNEHFFGGHMKNEQFQNTNGDTKKMSPLYIVLFLTIYLLLVLIAGQFLWNEVLCKVTTICKPMPSLLHLLGLILLLDLLMPRM